MSKSQARSGMGAPITELATADIEWLQENGIITALLRNAPYGIALLDSNLDFRWVNPYFLLLLGREENNYRDRNLRELVHPDDIRAFEELTAQIQTGVFPFGWLDIRMQTFDGRIVWTGLNLTRPLPSRSGSFLATLVDIGDRKTGEQQLRQLREQLAEIRQVTRVGQIDYFPTDGMVRVSQEWMRLLDVGRSLSECSIERFLDFFHPDDRDHVAEIFRNQPTGHEFDLHIRRADGQFRHLRCSGQVEVDGRPARYWRLTGQDITDWWTGDRRYRSMFHDNRMAVLVANVRDDTIRLANAAAEKFYGIPAVELQRMSLSDLTAGDAPLPTEALNGIPPFILSRHRLATGLVRDVMLIPSRLRYEEEPMAMIVVVDVTERKRNEDALSELNRSLEERIESEVRKVREQEKKIGHQSRLAALGEMASGIAHEINQPLNTISVTLDNLLAEISGTNPSLFVREKAEKIFQSIMRLRTFIDHIRVFSRAQDEPRNEVFKPAESIDNSLAIVSHRLKRESIQLSLDVDREPYTRGNPYKFEQVLMNLLSNSVDALLARDGGEELCIQVRLHPDGDRVIIEVEDNGIGIESRHLPHVMEPFFTTKDTDRGTGLGLSISYGTITEMNGKIEIYSRHRHWTLVRIDLPAVGKEEDEDPDQRPDTR